MEILPPVVLLVFWATVLLGMAPFLTAERFRALFTWPSDHWPLNYALVGSGVVALQVVAYLLVVVASQGPGQVTGSSGTASLAGLALATVAVPTTTAVGAAVVLPRRDAWTPTGGGVDGRIVLAGATVWYVLLVGGFLTVAILALLFWAIVNMPT